MCVFQVDVAEKRAFFGQKWLKNVHFFYRMAISSVPHWCWLVASMSLHFIGCECFAI
jgi:hypothetical protein